MWVIRVESIPIYHSKNVTPIFILLVFVCHVYSCMIKHSKCPYFESYKSQYSPLHKYVIWLSVNITVTLTNFKTL